MDQRVDLPHLSNFFFFLFFFFFNPFFHFFLIAAGQQASLGPNTHGPNGIWEPKIVDRPVWEFMKSLVARIFEENDIIKKKKTAAERRRGGGNSQMGLVPAARFFL